VFVPKAIYAGEVDKVPSLKKNSWFMYSGAWLESKRSINRGLFVTRWGSAFEDFESPLIGPWIKSLPFVIHGFLLGSFAVPCACDKTSTACTTLQPALLLALHLSLVLFYIGFRPFASPVKGAHRIFVSCVYVVTFSLALAPKSYAFKDSPALMALQTTNIALALAGLIIFGPVSSFASALDIWMKRDSENPSNGLQRVDAIEAFRAALMAALDADGEDELRSTVIRRSSVATASTHLPPERKDSVFVNPLLLRSPSTIAKVMDSLAPDASYSPSSEQRQRTKTYVEVVNPISDCYSYDEHELTMEQQEHSANNVGKSIQRFDGGGSAVLAWNKRTKPQSSKCYGDYNEDGDSVWLRAKDEVLKRMVNEGMATQQVLEEIRRRELERNDWFTKLRQKLRPTGRQLLEL